MIAATDPGELGAVELRRLLAKQRIKSGAASDDGEHRAVLGGDAIEPVGKAQAAGAFHVLHHNGGVARDVTADMPGEHAGIEIVAAADAVADVKLDVLAFVKVGGTLRLRHRGQGNHDRNRRQARQHAKRHFVLLRAGSFATVPALRAGFGAATN